MSIGPKAWMCGVSAHRCRELSQLVLGFALALVGAVCEAGPAPGQGLNPLAATSASNPIHISADNGIEWDQNQQVYVARGNAVAIRGTSEVDADVLTAHYRPSKNKSDGGNEVYRLDADGHVVLKGPNRTAVGDQAVYDVNQQIGVVTGQHLKLTTPTDTVTARDSLEWYDQQQVAVARGDAVAIRGDRRIRADVMTAHFIKDKNASGATPTTAAKPSRVKPAVGSMPANPAPASRAGEATQAGKPSRAPGSIEGDEGGSKLNRVDAQGHIVVVTATDIARGDYGVYNAQTGIVTLLGNVTVTRGQDTIRGQYAVVDLNTNISRMMTVAAKPGAAPARVEGLLYRQNATAGPTSAKKPGAKPVAATAPKS
jgi:lipopolysaccharide export system protein LptA